MPCPCSEKPVKRPLKAVLTLNNQIEVPPDGYRYFQAETKVWIEAPSFGELVGEVRKHRRGNNLPVGLLFEKEIEDQLCQRLPAGFCKHEDGRKSAMVTLLRGFAEFLTGTSTLIDWTVREGRRKVALEEANARAHTCSSCHFNRIPSGCSSCNSAVVMELVNRYVGGDKTNADELLRGCDKCGCSLKAKVWIPLEILHRHSPPEIEFPEWCWAKRAA